MIYRIAFGITGNSEGWSENHALSYPDANPNALKPLLTDVAQKRAQMLGNPYYINVIRMSRYANDDGTKATRGVSIIKGIFKPTGTYAANAAEPGNVAYLINGFAKANPLLPQFDGNKNQTFLGAPPDDAVSNGGIVDPSKAGQAAAFATWRSAMISNNFGWLASNPIADLPINVVVQLDDGRVQITTEGNINPAIPLNVPMPARIRKVNQGVSPLNGACTVTKTGNTTLVTSEVIAFALAQTGGFIKLYTPMKPFVAYSDLSLSLETAQHQRGRPLGASRGRAPRRIRG